MGGLRPKKFSTFGPSDASRKNTIKFHLMQAIAFYSPCFCLSNRVWHEQIVLCTIITDPNNFKCHGTIFAIFWHKKTHYFLERTHQNLTHRMHDATHWVVGSTAADPSVSEWVIKLNGLSGDDGQRGPYSSYKPCNHSLYTGIIIFPHIDNPQSTGHNLLW